MAEQKLNLLADFPAISTQEWKEKIIADLKGADFDKKLVWRTPEGFNVMPFYRQEDIEGLQTKDSAPGKFPYVRGTKLDNDWLIRQNIDAKDAAAANKKALDILNKGVNSIGFKLNKAQLSASYIETLLNGIYPECVELNFSICVSKTVELVGLLADYYKQKGYNLDKVVGSVNCDPINRMLKKGKKLDAAQIAEILKEVVEAGKVLPNYRLVAINSISLTNAGAYCSQELANAMAWGSQYMQMLTEAGVDANKAAAAIKFNFGVGGNYFMEIAKFRAARWLWAEILKAYGCAEENAKIRMHAETTTFNLTIFDAHVNLLRTQTEAMSMQAY